LCIKLYTLLCIKLYIFFIYQILYIFIHQVVHMKMCLDHETLHRDIILSRFDKHSQETQLTRFIEI